MIKDQESDLKFSNALISTLLKDSDLIKLKQRSVWDECRKEWSIPSFILTDKKADISFPNISGKSRVEQLKEERNI